MADTNDLTPFLTEPQLATPSRLNSPVIYADIGGLILLVIVAVFLGVQRLTAPPPPPVVEVNEAPAMTSPTPPLEPFIKVPVSFAGLDRRDPPPPPQVPVPEKLPSITPPPPIPQEPERKPAVETTPPPQQGQEKRAETPPAKRAPKRWLFAKMDQGIGKPPFPVLTPPKNGDEQKDGPGAGLVKPAQWVKPVDATTWLYRDQVIHGITLENINSDIPGDVHIYVNRDVTDILGQGQVLIPQHAKITATLERHVVQGQSRLDFNLVQIRFADGALVTVKGKVGDKSGAVGVPGEVDNHYGKILLGAGVSALLSIGARAPFGSTDNFQASLPQQFARDVSQDINSTGQQIVKRMTDIPPTIRAKAGDEVTIQLQENVSFAKEPTLVR